MSVVGKKVNENSLLVKNTTIYALGDILPKFLNFITFPILTIYLSPADYGIVNYINTLSTFLIVIGFLCLNTYYLVYYFRVGDLEEKRKLLGNLSLFVIAFNVFISVLMMLVCPYMFSFLGVSIAFYPYVFIGILINFFNVLSILPSALYRVQERPMPLTVINVLKGVLLAALTLFLVIYCDYKALGVLYANLIVSGLFGMVYLKITYKNIVLNINKKQIKEALYFSLPLLPGALAYYMVSMFDRILIERYLGLSELGIYSTASTLALLLNIVSYGAYKAFEPYFFKNYGNPSFREKFENIHRYYFFVVLIVAFYIALFSREFFQLFSGPSFHIAYFYVPIILIGVVFSSILMMYATIITAKNKTKINSIVTIIGGIVSISLNILFLSCYGIVIACLSSAISMAIMFFVSYYYTRINVDLRRPFLAFFTASFIIWISVYTLVIPVIYISIFVKLIISIIVALLIAKILKIDLVNLIYILGGKERTI